MTQALSESDIADALDSLPGWTHEDDALVKEFKFKDFRQAMGWIVRMAFEAEQRNHHPDLHHVYNRVTLRLSTHDADGKVTPKDLDLAQALEALR